VTCCRRAFLCRAGGGALVADREHLRVALWWAATADGVGTGRHSLLRAAAGGVATADVSSAGGAERGDGGCGSGSVPTTAVF